MTNQVSKLLNNKMRNTKQNLMWIRVFFRITTSYKNGLPRMVSFKRNEPGRVSSTNTRSTMLDRFIWNWELCQVMTNHLRFDFNLVESLAIVHSNNATNHLRYNDHIAEVGADWFWLLTWWCFPFLRSNIHANIIRNMKKHARINNNGAVILQKCLNRLLICANCYAYECILLVSRLIILVYTVTLFIWDKQNSSYTDGNIIV